MLAHVRGIDTPVFLADGLFWPYFFSLRYILKYMFARKLLISHLPGVYGLPLLE